MCLRILLLSLSLLCTQLGAVCVTQAQCEEIRLNADYWKADSRDEYNDADLIIDGLYLGNVCAAHNETWLRGHAIRLVISVAREWFMLCRDTTVDVMGFLLDDSNSENVTHTKAVFSEIADIIAAYSARGESVLVHCNMGISRSAAAVLAYMQRKYPRASYQRLLRIVKARRPVVRPNNLFSQILTEPEL